ncbi:MAG: acyl-CoA dehydrogenase family protein, partial [Actinomycetota bacterium]
MSTALSPQEAEEFASQVRSFLESNTSSGKGRDLSAAREFQGRLAEAGFAGIPFPKEYGGAGLTLEHERIFRQVAQGFPMMTGELVISHGMCLPVLNEFGTDEQKRKFMPDNISAKTVWCQ